MATPPALAVEGLLDNFTYPSPTTVVATVRAVDVVLVLVAPVSSVMGCRRVCTELRGHRFGENQRRDCPTRAVI